MTRSILITGGSGFIGSHAAHALVRLGWDVGVLDVDPPQFGDVRSVIADVRDKEAVLSASKKCDVILHLGSVVGVKPLLSDPAAAVDVIVNGTLNVLNAAACVGASVVHVSSSEVLGCNPRIPWAETADRVLGPAHSDRWAYGSAKAAAEHVALARGQSREVPVTVVRPFNVYGPRQRPHFVVPIMIEAALSGLPIPIHGDGTQTRCFTYVDDFLAALRCVIDDVGHAPVVHIGSVEEVTIGELALLVADSTGSQAGISYGADRPSGVDDTDEIPRRVPLIDLARDTWGWEPKVSIADGVQRTVQSWAS